MAVRLNRFVEPPHFTAQPSYGFAQFLAFGPQPGNLPQCHVKSSPSDITTVLRCLQLRARVLELISMAFRLLALRVQFALHLIEGLSSLFGQYQYALVILANLRKGRFQSIAPLPKFRNLVLTRRNDTLKLHHEIGFIDSRLEYPADQLGQVRVGCNGNEIHRVH
ncbi:hypothetical protein WI69_23720 [Burkholderia diffusa]|nr:hypothetical protein WI28_18860 [Burkholderia diffusa]KVC13112.1 hypothetical protein WI69_23720 [Burkholderia diffusa]